ncbi:MAG: DUF4238 domain-containing protein [Alphaproteobacteria bacterium]|nr:DUF4238 domain-containing protein [Alphaproteobacteria bacterium]
MNEPKRHHYVPRFYLRRFTNTNGQLWIWDRHRDKIFLTTPEKVAAENHFYHQADLLAHGHDPLTMEKQLAEIETDTAAITGQWVDWLRQTEPRKQIEIPPINREIVALFLALQFLRTADTREILSLVAGAAEAKAPITTQEARRLHTELLWDEETVNRLAKRITGCVWIFARNKTAKPYATSDNPVAFRTGDNLQWVKRGIYAPGTYVVYPLAPDIMMYCHPKDSPFDRLEQFDRALSPVEITSSLISSENSAQVFMASRFVISPCNDFEEAKQFAKTIGTDTYKPQSQP